MYKNTGATKVFPKTAIPKLPKILSKVGIFLKIHLQIKEKINMLQMLPLTFETLGTAENNVSRCLVMFRFESYSKHNSKHYGIFAILRHLHLPLLKKLKKQFNIFNMGGTTGFRIVKGKIVISILQIYDTEFG